MHMRTIDGYTGKHYSNVRLFIRDDLVSLYSPDGWQDFCYELFHNRGKYHLQKQTTYKSIFTLQFPPSENSALLVKKYTNRGLVKLLKSLFRPSPAFHEFRLSLAMHRRGIPSLMPVLVAELKKNGCIHESLVVMPFLSGAQELKDFFLKKEAAALVRTSLSERWEICKSFGRLTAHIFQSGLYQNDYSLNNFMIKKEGNESKIYFIDFERAEIKERLSETEKIELLTKLNRVGREVTMTDRFRFLRAYLEGAGTLKDAKTCARTLQKSTLAMLRRDLQRGRLTSVYTSENYVKFNTGGCRGMHKTGYATEEIMAQIAALPQNNETVTLSLHYGPVMHPVQVIPFMKGAAEKMWATINILILAGLPFEMPHVLLEGEQGGFLFLKLPESGTVQSFAAIRQHAGTRVMNVLEIHFAKELKQVGAMITSLCQ